MLLHHDVVVLRMLEIFVELNVEYEVHVGREIAQRLPTTS